MFQLPWLPMFPAVKGRAVLGYAKHLEIHAVTGANICFGMQSTPLMPQMRWLRKEHTKLSLQLMLIHMISPTSHSSNMGKKDTYFN
jgi:arginine decarboxylase-like protein